MSENQTNSTAEEMQSKSFTEALKPVSGLNTGASKISGILGMVGGAINVAMGIYVLVSGKNVLSSLGGARQSETALMNSMLNVSGAVSIIGGLVGIGFGKANYDSAKGAERARNFVELQQKLDKQAIGFAR